MIVVSDTSPITTLLRTHRAELLKAGLVNSLREVISELEREAAFHVSEEIKNVVLRQAGEL